VERGHIYIAQPPLYKVKRGKQEHYVKDEKELTNYLLQLALANARLYPGDNAPEIGSEGLEALIRQYLSTMEMIDHLSRRTDPKILEAMIDMPALEEDALRDGTRLQTWFEQLVEKVNRNQPTGTDYRSRVQLGPDGGFQDAVITKRMHGILYPYPFPAQFFLSQEYETIRRLSEALDGLLAADAEIRRGERAQPVTEFRQAVTWLMEEGKRGLSIQRYKGLGEMNPDQLWETTMDPDTRRLLQVRIEDVVASDDIFTTLMGDHVEPRRDFIEKNALAATNLDI
jgi:DNA gyrase subunit B